MKAVLRRIVKTSLTDADGNAINPVSAFTRFGCWPHGPRSYIAVIRSLILTTVAITMAVDFGLLDHVAHYRRQPNDGDEKYIPFFLRPSDILHVAVMLTLLLGVVASGFKRVDSEYETNYKKTFLVLWNLTVAVVPLTAVSLIFHFHVLRWNASPDDAYTAVVLTVFINSCFELLYGAWPAEASDVLLPSLLGLVFLAYTLVFAKLGSVLYVQLDWIGDPKTAASNAAVFEVVTVACSAVSTFIAVQRNRFFNRGSAPKYSALGEKAPLKGPGLA